MLPDAEGRIYLWEILVPHADNNGQTIQYYHHKAWDKKVVEIANGLTILRMSRGKWVSEDGKLVAEKMVPVRIACTENQMHKIIGITKQHYKQEAVMSYVVSDTVIIG